MQEEKQSSGMLKRTLVALGALVAMGLTASWWPKVASVVVIVVVLAYARHAWRTVAQLPARQIAELTVFGALALAAGFFAKYHVGQLVVTGVFVIVTFPLWRRVRHDERPAEDGPAIATEP